jgi:hypothetical protein
VSACFHPEYYDARSVGPLHHPLVTNAVHALFPDDPNFVDYVIWESRNSKHRRADCEPAKVASGMKRGSRLELLCIALAVDIHSDSAEPGHGLILVFPHHVLHLLIIAQAHKPRMPEVDRRASNRRTQTRPRVQVSATMPNAGLCRIRMRRAAGGLQNGG